MRTRWVQLVAAYICLWAVAFGGAISSLGLVVCTDEHGTRLEWSCDVNCCTSHDQPCQDVELKSDSHPAVRDDTRAMPVTVELAVVPTVEPVAFTYPTEVAQPVFRTAILRPPDSVARLRTVILVI